MREVKVKEATVEEVLVHQLGTGDCVIVTAVSDSDYVTQPGDLLIKCCDKAVNVTKNVFILGSDLNVRVRKLAKGSKVEITV